MKGNILLSGLLLCVVSVSAQRREVTDMAGRRIDIPHDVRRVFTDRFLSLTAFALDPEMVCNATFRVPEAGKKYISEAYYRDKPLAEDNEEEILRLHPDVILLSLTDEDSRETADRMQKKLQIPVLLVKFEVTEYRNAYRFLGQALNRKEAADRIIDFIDRYLIPLHEQMKKLADEQRPSVYYAEGNRGLNTEAAGSLHSQVIDWLNARNVAQVKTGSIHGMAAVSIEQVLMWNPEAIIVWSGFPAGMGLPQEAAKEKTTREHILTDPAWKRINAVRNGKVYQVPSLPFGWIDRPPGANCVPGILWLAHQIYPGTVTFDLNDALKQCFRLFYHVEITDEDIKSLISCPSAQIHLIPGSSPSSPPTPLRPHPRPLSILERGGIPAAKPDSAHRQAWQHLPPSLAAPTAKPDSTHCQAWQYPPPSLAVLNTHQSRPVFLPSPFGEGPGVRWIFGEEPEVRSCEEEPGVRSYEEEPDVRSREEKPAVRWSREEDPGERSDTLPEVTVPGRRRTSPLKEITVEPLAWESSITRITSGDNRKTAAHHLFDVLKYSVNGMASTQGRRKKHYYLLRGQNVASDYAINGVSLSTNGAGPMAEWVEAPSLLPESMIESVEIVRSGNSLLLGFSGLNGVINVKTKTFDKPVTRVEAEYGTFNTLHAGLLHGGKIKNLHYAFSLFNDRTDGPAGRHSNENLWNFYGKIDWQHRDKLEIHLESSYIYGTRFVTQAAFDTLAAPQSQLADLWEYDPMRYSISTARLQYRESKHASTELQFSFILNRMDLYPDRYHYTSAGKVVQLSDSIVRNRMLDEPDSIYTVALFQAFSPVEHNVARAGVMFASSANYAHGKSKKKILSATLLDQHTFGRTDVHLGLKLIREYYEYYVPYQGFGDDINAVTDRWQPALFNVSTGISHQFNAACILNCVINSGALPVDRTALQQQTDANGNLLIDENTGKTLLASLKGENRTGIELGLQQHIPAAGHLTWTLFLLNQKNTSEYTRTPYYDGNNVLRYYMKNIDLRTVGIELSCRSRTWMDMFSAFGNISCKYVYRSEPSGRTHYDRQPPLIANACLSFAKKELEIHLTAKYVSSYRSDRFLKTAVNMGNYGLADMQVIYHIHKRHTELYAHATNLFDVRYATVSPLYPDFGRQIRIGIRFTMNSEQ
ncbi:MAG: TonB-dependent receptor [Bacteroidales bacterium]|nr:TonB-dependent receptor [Bacteroidales bacterium]